MNLSALSVRHPIGTVLLTIGVALCGIVGFFLLPVTALPQIDLAVIQVSASIPGASPTTMATSVATPLEHRLSSIAGVNEMTSTSLDGVSRVTLQFDLDRDINGAARDVQAAINAARADLPTTLSTNPGYFKANPAAAPVLILALTSKTKTPGQIYEEANNTLKQRLRQVTGVGDVQIGGGSLPAVRIELKPFALNHYGISTEDVRAAIQASNANRPEGLVQGEERRLQIYTQNQGVHAGDYASMVIAWRSGTAIRLSDVADVIDGVEDTRSLGLHNSDRAIIVLVMCQPSGNAVATVDAIRAMLPTLQAQLPADVHLSVAADLTTSIRTSLKEVEFTLILSIVLVILVIALFLGNLRATLVPAVSTVVSLLGTFGVIYLLGFSLNNLTLMALTIATGFVVDDTIVVLENISRHMDAGMSRMRASLLGVREIGFTVITMSLSLVAVFIPLLFMGGITGRALREFAMTLSVAVMISLVMSLTTTPMMCALLLDASSKVNTGGSTGLTRLGASVWAHVVTSYARCLDWALLNKGVVILILLAVTGLNVYLFAAIPKSLVPEQDSGQLQGALSADQSISSKAMGEKLRQVMDIVRADRAVATVVGFTGGLKASGSGFMFVTLKPLDERHEKGSAVIERLRPQLAQVPGIQLFLNPVQDFHAGGRPSNARYQYTLKAPDAASLRTWSDKLLAELKKHPEFADLDNDQRENGMESHIIIDPNAAGRVGITSNALDAALYDSFGQRQVASIYTESNQYHVVMEWDPLYTSGPGALSDVYIPGTRLFNGFCQPSASGASSTSNSLPPRVRVSPNPTLRNASSGNVLSNEPDCMVPLSTIGRITERAAATAVNHQDGELASTLTFNLADGYHLSDAERAIKRAQADIAMPTSIKGEFAGTAAMVRQANGQQYLLIVATLMVIYIVLGVLYESLIHPLTVLSTLPSAGVGAMLALLLFRMDFSLIALIGVLLLIGIVKKNAILIVDFALEAERSRGLSSLQAVREACMLRFRPILMTTFAATLGALPLAIGFGEGTELRQPLGVAIIGGLIASQLLTLLTTPVVYLLLDGLRQRNAKDCSVARAGIAALQPNETI